MVKRFMVPMLALVTAETEDQADTLIEALQAVALKHGFSLCQDELVNPKVFDDEKDEIHSILDLVPIAELAEPYKSEQPLG